MKNLQDQLDGTLEFNCIIIKKDKSELPLDIKITINIWENEPIGSYILSIPEISLTIPLGVREVNYDIISDKLNNWIYPKTRGIQVTSDQVLKKLKKLGYKIEKYTGSHAQLKKDGNGYKVTVPVHKGTIPKGTFKSILNQMNMDLSTYNAI